MMRLAAGRIQQPVRQVEGWGERLVVDWNTLSVAGHSVVCLISGIVSELVALRGAAQRDTSRASRADPRKLLVSRLDRRQTYMTIQVAICTTWLGLELGLGSHGPESGEDEPRVNGLKGLNSAIPDFMVNYAAISDECVINPAPCYQRHSCLLASSEAYVLKRSLFFSCFASSSSHQ